MSIYSEKIYGIRAIKAGASAFLPKSTSNDELFAAIHKVSQGGKYITNSLAEFIDDSFDNSINNGSYDSLSNRELQVFQMIASGASTNEIARQLGLNSQTISLIRARLLSKMNMSSNAEIIRYAIEMESG